ncbi:LAETG motif-containing sortase-dependent surface protein [Streptomyces sp. NPDC059788]|uniref:LAETG motif-containing sortase-dependent surface protein n=1 Tax=Streptomyces sp. NPDC059788 TaxID=3346948 RepID=UPI0036560594
MKLHRTVAIAVAAAALTPAVLLTAPAAYATGTADEKLYSCSDVSQGDYEQKTLKLDQTDANGPVVRGGDWRTFRATVKNIGEKDVSTLGMDVRAWRQVDDEDPVVGKFVTFEYKTGEAGKWTPVDRESGRFVTKGVLKAGQTVTYQLRMRAAADLPKHMEWADVSVGSSFVEQYRFPSGEVVPCTAGETGQNGITIVNASEKPQPKPTPTVTPTKPGPAPSGTATPRPTPTTGTSEPTPEASTPSAKSSANVVTASDRTPSGPGGNLAETGSSDALPTIAMIGGAAVVAGGAAVLITRRRRTD